MVMKAVRNNGLYSLVGKTVIGGSVNVTNNTVDKTKLWHHRLGHVNKKGFRGVVQVRAFVWGQIGELEFCEHCVKGKAKRLKFSAREHITEGIFDYVLSNLWGPSRTVSHGGARYFWSIIDDYSRKVLVYLMKNKNDALEKFKN